MTVNRQPFVDLIVLGFSVSILLTCTLRPIRTSPLQIDEQVTYYLACGQPPTSLMARCLEQSATPPLYFGLVRATMSLAGLGQIDAKEFCLRLPSLLAGVGAVIIVWWFERQWLGGVGAGALLLACHADFLGQVIQSRPYVVGLLLQLLAGGLVVRLRQNFDKWSWLGLTLTFAAMLWTHYLFVAPAIVLVGCAGLAPRGSKPASVVSIGLALLLAGCTYGALLTGIFRLLANGSMLTWTQNPRPWQRQLELFPPRTTIALGVLALVVAGVVRLRRRPTPRIVEGSAFLLSWRGGLFLAVWTLAPVYGLWIVAWNKNWSLADPRYYFVQWGPAVLALAWLANAAGGRIGGLFIMLAAITAGEGRAALQAIHHYQHDQSWPTAARFLDEHAQRDDLVLTQTGLVETLAVPSHFADPGFQAYTNSRLSDFYRTKAFDCRSLPLIWVDEASEWRFAYERWLDLAARQHRDVWLVVSADSDLGRKVEGHALLWLSRLGWESQLVHPDTIARIHRLRWPARLRQ